MGEMRQHGRQRGKLKQHTDAILVLKPTLSWATLTDSSNTLDKRPEQVYKGVCVFALSLTLICLWNWIAGDSPALLDFPALGTQMGFMPNELDKGEGHELLPLNNGYFSEMIQHLPGRSVPRSQKGQT